MNKKGIFTPTLIILSIVLFVSLNYYLNPMFSSDYRFKFIDILDEELELKRELFNSEQEIKYKAYEALEILFKEGICDDWSTCNPIEEYESEFKSNFDRLYDGDYKVIFSFNGVKIDASKDIEYERENLKINTKHVFSYTIDFDWNIVRELYEECKNAKSCDELEKYKDICEEDDDFLNFEYSISLEFVKTLKFRVSKRGGLF